MALRRMKGRHMYDAIAAILDDIHLEYRIRKKNNSSHHNRQWCEFRESVCSVREETGGQRR